MAEPHGSAESPGLRVELHGPGVTIDDVIQAGEATKRLLGEVGRPLGVPADAWKVQAIYFQCDRCGLRRPDRPGPDEGWTFTDGDDLCPSCSTGAKSVGALREGLVQMMDLGAWGDQTIHESKEVLLRTPEGDYLLSEVGWSFVQGRFVVVLEGVERDPAR